MSDEENILVCAPVGGDHTTGSIVRSCGGCGCDVWLSLSGQKVEEVEPGIGILCVSCAMPRIRGDAEAEVRPAPGALTEWFFHYLHRN